MDTSKYNHALTLKFQSVDARKKFIHFWMNGGGEEAASMVTKCEPENPSWQGENPVLYIDPFPQEEDIGLFDSVY